MAARRRRRRFRRAARPDRAWYTNQGTLSINPDGNFVDFARLVDLADITYLNENNWGGEKGLWVCERVMLDMYPFLSRFDPSDDNTSRYWQWALATADEDEALAYSQSSTALIADMYDDNNNELFGATARVLQQGNAPVYDNTIAAQQGAGGRLLVDTAGTLTKRSIVWGAHGFSSVRGVDFKTLFGLREQQACFLFGAVGQRWGGEDGDLIAVDWYVKMLWRKKR